LPVHIKVSPEGPYPPSVGRADATVRRAACFGDGWVAGLTDIDELPELPAQTLLDKKQVASPAGRVVEAELDRVLKALAAGPGSAADEYPCVRTKATSRPSPVSRSPPAESRDRSSSESSSASSISSRSGRRASSGTSPSPGTPGIRQSSPESSPATVFSLFTGFMILSPPEAAGSPAIL
jgi:hypothetical protein